MTTISEIQLDAAVLEGLARIICGDEDGLRYRKAWEIEKFFRAAGWSVPELDMESRRGWTIARLHEGMHDGVAVVRLVLRLADRREYLGEDAAHRRVLDELNLLLETEGYAVVDERPRPRLVEADQGVSRMEAPIELTASLGQVVSDREFGQQLRRRLEEAHRCWKAGAPTAAIIMLGSVLEGVLYDVALSRHDTGGKAPTDRLESLINLAGERRWIAKEVVDYAHVLRDHRNLVHPRKQWTQSYAPEDDTVEIAWRVVVAALNDLAELPPP